MDTSFWERLDGFSPLLLCANFESKLAWPTSGTERGTAPSRDVIEAQ